MPSRALLLQLEKPEDVFDIQPLPAALLVDLEGTLTEFSPSATSVIEAVTRFDALVIRSGLDLRQVRYVTNASFQELQSQCPAISNRIHTHACKPFFTPPSEFRLTSCATVVVGDQYLTDGLLAWRLGVSFALVRSTSPQPMWPRLQSWVGWAMSPAFFKWKR